MQKTEIIPYPYSTTRKNPASGSKKVSAGLQNHRIDSREKGEPDES